MELFLEEAVRFKGEGRYGDSLRVLEKALEAARQLHDIGLEVRAARQQADAFQALGLRGDVLSRCSWILAVDEARAYSRFMALRGIARCEIASGNTSTGRRLAHEALELAEPMGDDAVSLALETLTDAALAEGDFSAACVVSERLVETARRLGGATDLFFALHRAAVASFARGDAARVGKLLADAQTFAEALDRADGSKHHQGMLDLLRGRLTGPEG